jgi:hypothetical protein
VTDKAFDDFASVDRSQTFNRKILGLKFKINKMKIKYLLVAVAMIGLTSFANANLEETYIEPSKTNSSKIQISEGEINS